MMYHGQVSRSKTILSRLLVSKYSELCKYQIELVLEQHGNQSEHLLLSSKKSMTLDAGSCYQMNFTCSERGHVDIFTFL